VRARRSKEPEVMGSDVTGEVKAVGGEIDGVEVDAVGSQGRGKAHGGRIQYLSNPTSI
jgi:NADPH:quinone reductase-like Zn-dependent oxidoreductase